MNSCELALDNGSLAGSDFSVGGSCGGGGGRVNECEREIGIKFVGLAPDLIYLNIFRYCENIKSRRLAKTFSDCYSNLVYSALSGRLEKGDVSFLRSMRSIALHGNTEMFPGIELSLKSWTNQYMQRYYGVFSLQELKDLDL